MNDTSSQPARRWLVTGAAGFIGCNLARFLLQRGETVVGVDNFFSGKRENVDRLAARFPDGFEFVEADIVDGGGLAAAADGCDAVAHLAAQVSVMRSIDDPEETHAINGTGFLNAFRAAAETGAGRFVYASSCAVYGDNDDLPLPEEATPRPLSPYAATKLANEVYAAGFAVTAGGMQTTGLRFFNIFGPWQNPGGGYAAVIPKWIERMLSGATPVLFGDGSATRDFCYVDNVCEAVWQAASNDAKPGIYNVATGVATRLDALYETIRNMVAATGHNGVIPPPNRQPQRPGEILHSVGDPSKAERVLGFQARIGLEEGIRRLLEEEYGMNKPTASQASGES